METPFFSIIVPIYKTEAFLHQCVDSLIGQTYQNIEIILVDDGSPDQSAQICDSYSEKYANIKVIHKQNGGLSDARNTGLVSAIGEFILFVDSDDYLEKNACEIFFDQLRSNSKIDVLFANHYLVKNNQITQDLAYAPEKKNLSGPDYLLTQLQNHSLHKTVWRNVYRRLFLTDNQLFFEKGIYHEDDLWTPQVMLKAAKVTHIDYCFYYYLIRADSIMSQKATKHYSDALLICEKLSPIYSKLNDPLLRRLLQTGLFNTYMHSYLKLRRLDQTMKPNHDFLLKNSRTVKNQMKAFLIRRFEKTYMNYLSRKET